MRSSWLVALAVVGPACRSKWDPAREAKTEAGTRVVASDRAEDAERDPDAPKGTGPQGEGAGAGVGAGAGAVGAAGANPGPGPGPDASGATAVDAAVRPGSAWLPARPGVPPPFDQLAPYMKRVDVFALVARLGIASAPVPATFVPRSATVAGYATAIPGVVATFMYGDADDRLDQIAFLGVPSTGLQDLVLRRWGDGTAGEKSDTSLARVWPATAAGWTARLSYPLPVVSPGDAVGEWVRLDFMLADVPRADPVQGAFTPKLWSQIATAVGGSGEAARATFGPALLLESADDDEDAPRAEQTDHPQGYLRLSTSWSSQPWELRLRFDPAGIHVTEAVLDGITDDEGARIALFGELKRAFGPPRTVITDAGRLEIGFSRGTLELRVDATDSDWSIAFRRR